MKKCPGSTSSLRSSVSAVSSTKTVTTVTRARPTHAMWMTRCVSSRRSTAMMVMHVPPIAAQAAPASMMRSVATMVMRARSIPAIWHRAAQMIPSIVTMATPARPTVAREACAPTIRFVVQQTVVATRRVIRPVILIVSSVAKEATRAPATLIVVPTNAEATASVSNLQGRGG